MAKTPKQAPPASAATKSVRQLFLSGRFEPSRGQRTYQWAEPNWKALLADLSNVFGYAQPDEVEPDGRVLHYPKVASFYLGHILLCRESESDKSVVYDGQQRLTTLTLLLCAIRDTIGKKGDDGEWLDIQEIIRTPPPRNEPRLSIPGGANALALIVASLQGTKPPENLSPFSPAGRRMFECGEYFKSALKLWTIDHLRGFRDFLLDKVFVTVTYLTDKRIAEYAYITINTRGKLLENTDIIKGHFTQIASLSSLVAATEIAERWSSLERAAAPKRFERILKAAFMLEFKSPPHFDFGSQIMDHFASEDRLPAAKDWLDNTLRQLVAIDNELIRKPARQAVLTAPSVHIRRMTFLPWDYWLPIVYRLNMRDAKAPTRFSRSLAQLERWCFAVNLLDLEDDRIADSAIGALRQLERGTDPFASSGRLTLTTAWKERVRTRLKDGQVTDNERRGAHVRWLETLYWPATGVNFTATNGTSVEHVLPRRPDAVWRNDFPTAINIYAEQFGNLCLVPKNINEEIGNKPYASKRAEYLKLAAQFRSARDVAQSERWTMAAVQERTDRLYAMAAKALALE